MKRLSFFLILLAMSGSAMLAADGPDVLPVKGSISVHDPTIIRGTDGAFYRFATGAGIPVAVSADLVTWKSDGTVFGRNPEWTARAVPGSGDLWAPDIVHRSGKYWLYYSVSTFGSNTSAIGLATNVTLDRSSTDYRWVDEGQVFASGPGDNFNAIDPAVVSDADGSLWMAFGSFWSGIKLLRLNPGTGKPDPGAKLIPIADRRVPPNAVEAAFILPKDGWYYLFVSFDFCCRGARSTYKIAVGRSSSIAGPYTDLGGRPLLEGGGTLVRTGDEQLAGAGHNSVLRVDDAYYLVYHAYDRRYGGRSLLRIEKLGWDRDGWPVVPSQPVVSE